MKAHKLPRNRSFRRGAIAVNS